uniref:Putative secreted protein n=1 Tax=Lutzomyia longipalpis TaxID=7200 RepID=A0A1B0CC82_LUTLO
MEKVIIILLSLFCVTAFAGNIQTSPNINAQGLKLKYCKISGCNKQSTCEISASSNKPISIAIGVIVKPKNKYQSVSCNITAVLTQGNVATGH